VIVFLRLSIFSSNICSPMLFFLFQAKKILEQRIEKDQFLELVTVKTEVRIVCKELYRSIY